MRNANCQTLNCNCIMSSCHCLLFLMCNVAFHRCLLLGFQQTSIHEGIASQFPYISALNSFSLSRIFTIFFFVTKCSEKSCFMLLFLLFCAEGCVRANLFCGHCVVWIAEFSGICFRQPPFGSVLYLEFLCSWWLMRV